MALPFSINTTYAPGAQVKSADLNAMQSSIAARHNRSIPFAGSAFQLSGNTANALGGWIIDFSGAVYSTAASGAKAAVLDLSPWVIPGDTIKEIAVKWRNGAAASAGGSLTATMYRAAHSTFGNGTPSVILTATALDTTTGGANLHRTQTLAVAHTVLADSFYSLRIDMNTTAGNDSAWLGGVALVLGV